VRIDLSPLDSDSCDQLVFNLLEIAGIPDELKERILSKAAGNPFYIEEILRSLMDKGYLSFRNRVWEATRETIEVTIPPTVQGVIASRIDHLEPDERDVLQTASVIGQTFYVGILEPICDDDLSLRLGNLEEHEFIQKSEGEYEFKHPLIHEVAYNTLLKSKRSELHKKVGERMEELFKDRISDFYPLLSRQYYYAKVWDKAYDYSIKSAKSAQASYQNVEAMRFCDRAIECLRSDESREARKKEIEAMEEKTRILILIGRLTEAMDLSDKAIQMSREINDKNSEAECLTVRAGDHAGTGQFEEMRKTSEEALVLFRDVNDKEGKARALGSVGIAYSHLGKRKEALECYLHSRKIVKDLGDKALEARLLNNIGSLCRASGEVDEELKCYSSALKISEESGDKRGQQIILGNIANVYGLHGRYEEAMKHLKSSLEIGKETGYRSGEASVLRSIGFICLYLGRYQEALESLQLSLSTAREIGNRRIEAGVLFYTGGVYCRLGNHDLAIQSYCNALNVAREMGYKRVEGTALLDMSEIHEDRKEMDKAHECLTSGKKILEETGGKEAMIDVEIALGGFALKTNDFDGTESHVESALKLVDEFRAKPLKAEVMLLLGRLNSARSKWSEAKSAFDNALKSFEEMSQPFELAQTHYYFGCALKRSDNEGFRGHLKEAHRIFKRIGSKNWVDRVNAELAREA
jgi:predicted ATPase